MHITRKWLSLLSLFILLFALTGCFELGSAYNTSTQGKIDEDAYYDAYGDVVLLDYDGSKSTYSMSDFYNKDTVNDFECALESKEYTYLGIELEKDLDIGEIVLYFNSPISATIGVSFYIVDEMPTIIAHVDSTGKVQNVKLSNEPSIDKRVATASTRLVSNKWNSIYLKRTGTQSLLHVKSEQFLLVRIENNCYDIYQKELDKAKEEFDSAYLTYQTDLAFYNEKLKSGSQVEIDAAKTKVEKSLSELNKAQEKYNQAKKDHDENKNPYTTRLSLKITDILIYAE